MPCHAMHPIQDLFLESFSYALQFDVHFYMHSYVDKNLILVKSGCYNFAAPNCLPDLTESPCPAGYPSTGLTRNLPHQPPTLTYAYFG
jgi:hypothetical protein